MVLLRRNAVLRYYNSNVVLQLQARGIDARANVMSCEQEQALRIALSISLRVSGVVDGLGPLGLR